MTGNSVAWGNRNPNNIQGALIAGNYSLNSMFSTVTPNTVLPANSMIPNPDNLLDPFRFKDPFTGAVGRWYTDRLCLAGFNVTAKKTGKPN